MKTKQTLDAIPQAQKKDHFHEKFGDKILDTYYWLKERDQSEVLHYLKEENEYAKNKLEPLADLKETLFQEMKERLPQKRDQEPVPIGDYFYYSTWEKEKQYPIHKRKKKLQEAQEEVILDENAVQTNTDFLDIDGVSISPNHKILAYALDDKGREFYNIYFKDLTTGKLLSCSILEATSDFVWANDNTTIFYVKQDVKTLRAFQVYRFNIETGQQELVYEEKDLKFSVYLNKNLSEEWIMLVACSSQTSECYFLSANNPEKDFLLFYKRRLGHEYHLDYGDGFFYILTNTDEAFNFQMMRVSIDTQAEDRTAGMYPKELWEKFVFHREDVYIENFEVFKNFLALETRFNGCQRIEILDKKADFKSHRITFPEKIYSIDIDDNEEYETPFLRLVFQSLTQPPIVYDYEVEKRKLHFKNQVPVQGDFSSSNYISQSEYAVASDGAKIPISLVYRKDIKIQGSTPLLLYAYGSYGASMDPGFSSGNLSLLDRGFIYAIAHIRGGSEKGRKWYEGGKLLNKENTFSDFISCAEHLISKKYTSNSHLYIMGGSAGGLLIGAVLNKRPDLFNGAIASVPFVDCLTTMLDESIPLSTGEYEEWGNPNEKKYYDYIKSYAPYNNIKKTKYPHLLIQSGYYDPRVQYWEPAKWTAKLRNYKTDKNLLLLLMDMVSGHFGASGRLELLKLYSLYFSFLIGLEKSLIGSVEDQK